MSLLSHLWSSSRLLEEVKVVCFNECCGVVTLGGVEESFRSQVFCLVKVLFKSEKKIR